MEPNTITTIGSLKAGDVFSLPGYSKFLMKVDAAPVRKAKHLYECAAVIVGMMEPRPFKATVEVTYLFTSLSVT